MERISASETLEQSTTAASRLSESNSGENDERNIMIPVDTTDHSLRAFHWYLDNMKHSSDKVYLVHCNEPPVLNKKKASPLSKSKITDQDWEDASDARKKEEEFINKRYGRETEGMDNFNLVHIPGKVPGDVLLKFAAEKQIRTIVIGSRGLGINNKDYVGGVSNFVASNANAVVIIIPPHGK